MVVDSKGQAWRRVTADDCLELSAALSFRLSSSPAEPGLERAARALANQSLPYSVCTILRDEEVSSSFSIIVHIKMYIPRFTLPLILTKRRRIEIFVADTTVDFSSPGCKM